MALSGKKDIDFKHAPEFSKRFLLQGTDKEGLKKFFDEEMIEFLLKRDIYHIESNGNSLLIFRSLRVARTEDIEQMIRFSEQFIARIK
jgi:carbonic anhydrase